MNEIRTGNKPKSILDKYTYSKYRKWKTTNPLMELEAQQANANQRAYENKLNHIEGIYQSLPPYAQVFVDRYREAINRSGRFNPSGSGVDEVLNFVHDIRTMIDESYKIFAQSGTKGSIGNYTKGSGV